MDVNINKLRRSTQQLLQLTASQPQEDVFVLNLHKFLKKKVSEHISSNMKSIDSIFKLKRYVEQDVDRLFDCLSQQLTVSDYTVPLAVSFEEQLLLLLTMTLRGDVAENVHQYRLECIALGKLMHLSVEAKRLVIA